MSKQPKEWKDRIVGFGREKVSNILFNPFNFRYHARAQKDLMEGILEDVGWIAPVLINQRTGHLVDGAMRVDVAMANGGDDAEVPVLYLDLSPEEEKLALATFDPVSAYAYRDNKVFEELIEGLESDNDALMAFLVSATGADKAVLDELGPDTEPDEVGEDLGSGTRQRAQNVSTREGKENGTDEESKLVFLDTGFTRNQLNVVHRAMEKAMEKNAPNQAEALVSICSAYLSRTK